MSLRKPASLKGKHTGSVPSERQAAEDQAAMDAQPDWDRMGEIADRLLSTPPDRQAVGKALAPKAQSTRSKWRA